MNISKKLQKKLQKATGVKQAANLFLGDFGSVEELGDLSTVQDGSIAIISDSASVYTYNAENNIWNASGDRNVVTVDGLIEEGVSLADGEYLFGINGNNDLVKIPPSVVNTNIKNVIPTPQGTFRVRAQTTSPGWAYTNVGGGSTAFQVIDVEPETAYIFEDCTWIFDNFDGFIFINRAGSAFGRYEGPANENIITPRDCVQVVFSLKNSAFGANLRFKKVVGYQSGVTGMTGANLADGDYQFGYQVIDDGGGNLIFSASTAVTSSSIPVEEGKTYYYYKNRLDNGISNVALAQDANDNNIQYIESVFSGSGTNATYTTITIPEGLDITKIRLLIATGTTRVNEVISGDLVWGLTDEFSYRIVEDYKPASNDVTLSQAINDVYDLKQAVNKNFQDKNLMIMGDSVYATQSNADNAYYNNDILAVSHQAPNKLRGGACAEIVRRLRPATWTNYSHGGFTMTYTGSSFGNQIYLDGSSGSYLYRLEQFFSDYDAYIADPVTNASSPRYAPDVFVVASCINDFINPTEAWVTDAELTASGKDYDQYMEDTFMTSDANNSTLIDLENVDLTKIAGALRYIMERMHRKFPKCYLAVVTPNKTSIHKRENQYKCVRDMIWMAERLNIQVIDVFNGGSQMINIREFNDSVSGTQDELYMTSDGTHPYGSTGNGDERQGRFITNELVKGYFSLEDFV